MHICKARTFVVVALPSSRQLTIISKRVCIGMSSADRNRATYAPRMLHLCTTGSLPEINVDMMMYI